jgi:hypothetical protein
MILGARRLKETESSNRDKRSRFSGPNGSNLVLAVTVISENTQKRIPSGRWYGAGLGLVQKLGHAIPTNAVSMFHALQLKFVSDRIASYAMHGADAMVLVNVMRIPCFGRRMIIGRASISWPGAS